MHPSAGRHGDAFFAEEKRLILLHELIHARSWDVLFDRIAAFLTYLHWFNPAAWLALARLRQERELRCDEALLDLAGEKCAASYGRTLLKIVEDLKRPVQLPGAVGVFGGTRALTRRIQMIARYRRAAKWQKARAQCWSCCCLSSDCARANPLSGGKTPKRKRSRPRRRPTQR